MTRATSPPRSTSCGAIHRGRGLGPRSRDRFCLALKRRVDCGGIQVRLRRGLAQGELARGAAPKVRRVGVDARPCGCGCEGAGGDLLQPLLHLVDQAEIDAQINPRSLGVAAGLAPHRAAARRGEGPERRAHTAPLLLEPAHGDTGELPVRAGGGQSLPALAQVRREPAQIMAGPERRLGIEASERGGVVPSPLHLCDGRGQRGQDLVIVLPLSPEEPPEPLQRGHEARCRIPHPAERAAPRRARPARRRTIRPRARGRARAAPDARPAGSRPRARPRARAAPPGWSRHGHPWPAIAAGTPPPHRPPSRWRRTPNARGCRARGGRARRRRAPRA